MPPSIQISPMILRHRVWNYCKHLISDGAIGMLGFPKVGLRLGKLVAAPLARLKDRLCCSPAVRMERFRVFLGRCSGWSRTSELQLKQLLKSRSCLWLFIEDTGTSSTASLILWSGGNVGLFPCWGFSSLLLAVYYPHFLFSRSGS